MARGIITAQVLGYLSQARPGEAITLSKLVVELGLTDPQAQAAMYRIVQGRKWPLEVISAGRLWRNAASEAPEEPEPTGPTVTIIEDIDTVKVLNIDGYVYIARWVGTAEEG